MNKKRPAPVVSFYKKSDHYLNLPKKNKLDSPSGPGSMNGSNGTRSAILEQRRSLPVFSVRTRLINEIQSHQVLIIIGETASGKSTQIPQFIYEEKLFKGGMIAVTQPRRVAAVTLSRRVSAEMEVDVGDVVGYSIRFEDVSSPKTKIKYLTDGMLFREAMLDPMLLRYSFIILDEAHERSINTDVLFGIVKKALHMRKEKGHPLKVIVMSATMDVDHFSKYFYNARVLYLEGRQYPIQVYYAKQSLPDYQLSCLTTIIKIHMEEPAGQDILVFLTGQEEIESMVYTLRMAAKDLKGEHAFLRVYSLYSALPMNRMMELFRPSSPKERKVILSTNVAETSITLPGIKFVIDCGHVKVRTHQPGTRLDLLKVQKISQAQAWQRTGRAGRDSPGSCYRTYTRKEFNAFSKNTTPEILRCNLASVLLQLLQVGVDAYSFDFMDKPPQESLDQAVKLLKMLGAIDSEESRQLTPLGKKMAQFPLDPRLGKILLSSKDYNCSEEVLSIVSVLSGESVFLTSQRNREKALEKHQKFYSSEGDLITLLNVFRAFNGAKSPKMFCEENFLNSRSLSFALEIRKQLAELCEKNDISLKSCGQNTDVIRKCLVSGYFMNVAELQRDKKYLTVDSRQQVSIHPSSVLHRTLPHFVIFSEVVHTSKCYIRQLSIVDPDCLNDIAPDYIRQHRLSQEKVMK